MNVNEFAVLISKKEKGKEQVNIAQIKEILKCINVMTKGVMYGIIKCLPKKT